MSSDKSSIRDRSGLYHRWVGYYCTKCRAERVEVGGQFLYTFVSPETLIDYFQVRTKPKCVREMKRYNIENGRNTKI